MAGQPSLKRPAAGSIPAWGTGLPTFFSGGMSSRSS